MNKIDTTNDTAPKFYSLRQVHALLFKGALSLTSVHVMARKGLIPTQTFLSKRLVPAAWVQAQLKNAEEVNNAS